MSFYLSLFFLLFYIINVIFTRPFVLYALISLAEKHFLDNGIYTSILTTDTAACFYKRHGYVLVIGFKRKIESLKGSASRKLLHEK